MHTYAVLTISDKGYAGERDDASGREIIAALDKAGYARAFYGILPDERDMIAAELRRLCDENVATLILTTGGTGFSPRDLTPEATLDVAERLCPGIPEALRTHSMAITKRAMLTRGTAAIRAKSLIVNLPGSAKAVRECLEILLDPLAHGLDILTGAAAECAR